MDAHLTRGRLIKLGGGVAAALGLGAVKGSWPGDEPALAADEVACVLTPEQTEGPYYLDAAKLRRNITEGRPGTALTLRLTVVDADTCRPIKGAAVDVWHCDAGGAYSGFDDAGSNSFLRGIQRTDAKDVAVFRTIYPGWYRGRTVHIHVKVHVGGEVIHTGQLYFPDRITDAVHRRGPYNTRGARTTRNSNDRLYGEGGSRSQLRLHKDAKGAYVGTLAMGVAA
jgi:protocatechuate 3,4-dioxygenase beta subunit